MLDGLLKTLRGIRIYAIAFKVYMRNDKTMKEADKIKRRLNLETEEESDEHPEILALWYQTHEINAKLVYETMIEFKGLWIKLGQYLSARTDIIPYPYVEKLKTLQDSVPPIPWNKINQVLISQFGKDYQNSIFSFIDKTPLSTASIAQVNINIIKIRII